MSEYDIGKDIARIEERINQLESRANPEITEAANEACQTASGDSSNLTYASIPYRVTVKDSVDAVPESNGIEVFHSTGRGQDIYHEPWLGDGANPLNSDWFFDPCTDMRNGWTCAGPYIRLEAGSYEAVWRVMTQCWRPAYAHAINRDRTAVSWDVTAGIGRVGLVARNSVTWGQCWDRGTPLQGYSDWHLDIEVEFTIPDPMEGVEFRVKTGIYGTSSFGGIVIPDGNGRFYAKELRFVKTS